MSMVIIPKMAQCSTKAQTPMASFEVCDLIFFSHIPHISAVLCLFLVPRDIFAIKPSEEFNCSSIIWTLIPVCCNAL